MTSRRIFAIIPAAGLSRRMGQPKLLLPWNGATIMDAVIAAWMNSHVTHVIVVIRKDDTSLWDVCLHWPIDVVRPSVHPADMKASVQHGLRHVADTYRPTLQDQWMVAPADLPRLDNQLINQVIEAGQMSTDGVVAPRFGDRQGHPILLPWSISTEVFALAEHEGINQILARRQLTFVDLPAASHVGDVDTPQEYRQLGGDPARPGRTNPD